MTYQELDSLINIDHDSFFRKNGRRPDNLYLGREDIRIIQKWFAETGVSFRTNPRENRRSAYCGMFIFVVDDDHHVAVS